MVIKIIVDSTCDIDVSREKDLDINILPLTVYFGEEEFHDGIDISKKEFFTRMRAAAKSPTTSQVTPLAFEKLFQKYSNEGHEILVITLASLLSGTYQSAHIAKNTIDTDKIYIIDSETTTMGLAWLVHEAIAMRAKGYNAKAIVDKLESLKKKIIIYAMIEDLVYLKKGGPLSAVSATLGTILNLNPIIQIRMVSLPLFKKQEAMPKPTSGFLIRLR